tara:strand:- start:891 stop:1277 length:387 start_codon:yes stop_codon:yes gene_type:complete
VLGVDEGGAEGLRSGKVSLERYRRASADIVDVFRQYCPKLERASIDECFLDLTASCAAIVRNSARADRLQSEPRPAKRIHYSPSSSPNQSLKESHREGDENDLDPYENEDSISNLSWDELGMVMTGTS